VLVAHARQAAEGKKLFIYGHSLGALIAARWALGKPEGISGLLLASPFVALGFEPPRLKVLAAQLVDKVVPWLPMGNELKAEQLTRDAARQEESWKDPLYLHVATPRWFNETRRVQAEVMRRAGEILVPCLVAMGTDDTITATPAMRDFFSRLGASDKTLLEYPGARHELFNELERQKTAADLLGWIAARVPAAAAATP
jgi:alpha-beta hydrolase superfamily lysophospholipase